MITGSYPPETCGVGDYTYNFIQHANKEEWTLYSDSNWSIKKILSKIRLINRLKIDNIFIQYPTEGYGWSLVPQFLAIHFSLFTSKKVIVILHEFSNRTFRAKLATSLFFCANRLIFTTNYEREFATKTWHLNKSKSKVVRILSNIDKSLTQNKWNDKIYDLIYFGHLRPLKGLEDFLDVCKSLLKERKCNIVIMGQSLPSYEVYLNKLRSEYSSLDIKWMINQNKEEVSRILSLSKVCFLPFPDGLSERRGSFLAALLNQSIILTYKGKYTTNELQEIAYLTNKDKAKNAIIDILDKMSQSDFNNYISKSQNYIASNLPSSWEEIVEECEQIVN